MQHNIHYRTLYKGKRLLFLGLVVLATGCYRMPDSHPEAWYVDNALKILEQNPWNDSAPVRSIQLKSGGSNSIHLIQVRKDVTPHYHAWHDETVYVIEGHGLFRIGNVTREVKAGHVLYIPAMAKHSFVNQANQPTTVISIFHPPHDGQDRIPVDWADYPQKQ